MTYRSESVASFPLGSRVFERDVHGMRIFLILIHHHYRPQPIWPQHRIGTDCNIELLWLFCLGQLFERNRRLGIRGKTLGC
jgi:hypothetical protein